MKKISSVGLFLMLALCLLPAAGSFAAEQTIVFVDMNKLFDGFYKTKVADGKLKERADEFNDERKGIVDDAKKLEDEFNALREDAQNTALSSEVREQKRNQAEDKLIEIREYESKLRRFDESRKKQLDDQSRRMRKDIVEEIRTAIQTYARSQGVSAVLDSSGQSLNGVEQVLYTDGKVDITEGVLDLLNKGEEKTKTLEK